MLLFYKIVTALYFLTNVVSLYHLIREDLGPHGHKWYKRLHWWLFCLLLFTPSVAVAAFIEQSQKRKRANKHKNS